MQRMLNKIVMQRLVKNSHPKAIEMLREYEGTGIDYGELSSNVAPGAMELMMERTKGKLSELQIQQLCSNESDEAMDLILSGEFQINWISLSGNSNSRAVSHLKENEEKICWQTLNKNSNPAVCDLLEPERLSPMLCFNTSDRALDILNENPRHILSYLLVSNPNPKAFELLRSHNLVSSIIYSPSPLAMNNLAKSTNPEAIDLLIKNLDNFHWREIWSNPSPRAINLIRACHTRTWHQYCPYMAFDLRDKTEERLYHAMDKWATTEMCKNTNPQVLEFLDFRKVDYGLLSENPIIFKL